jgi:hypothetical protein
MVKRATPNLVVLGMDFEEADVWLRCQNLLKMFRLESHTRPNG